MLVSGPNGCVFAAGARWLEGDLIEIRIPERACGWAAGTTWTTRGRTYPSGAQALADAVGPLPTPRNAEEEKTLEGIRASLACEKQRVHVEVPKGTPIEAARRNQR